MAFKVVKDVLYFTFINIVIINKLQTNLLIITILI